MVSHNQTTRERDGYAWFGKAQARRRSLTGQIRDLGLTSTIAMVLCRIVRVGFDGVGPGSDVKLVKRHWIPGSKFWRLIDIQHAAIVPDYAWGRRGSGRSEGRLADVLLSGRQAAGPLGRLWMTRHGFRGVGHRGHGYVVRLDDDLGSRLDYQVQRLGGLLADAGGKGVVFLGESNAFESKKGAIQERVDGEQRASA